MLNSGLVTVLVSNMDHAVSFYTEVLETGAPFRQRVGYDQGRGSDHWSASSLERLAGRKEGLDYHQVPAIGTHPESGVCAEGKGSQISGFYH